MRSTNRKNFNRFHGHKTKHKKLQIMQIIVFSVNRVLKLGNLN